MNTFRLSLLSLAAFALLLVSGCADALIDPGATDEAAGDVLRTEQQGKLRHAHLLDQAQRTVRVNTGTRKGQPAYQLEQGDTPAVNLVLGLNFSVDKQKLLSRFKLLSRYKLLSRFEYNQVFNGLAITVTDETGAGDFAEFFAELNADPDIAWYEPDFTLKTTHPQARPASGGQQVPWSVAFVGGQQSWTVSGNGSGSVDVDVYVFDTGVTNNDINVVESIDFVGSGSTRDYDGHGTHVAGIAAAIDDGDGLVGLAPGARVHNLKVLGDNGTADVSATIAAIEYVTEQKKANPSRPMVVNLSLGEDVGTQNYTALDDAVLASARAGVVYVAAAGNHGKDAAHVTPAHIYDIITVASFGPDGRFSPFSNWGTHIDILAPGEGIVSLAPSTDGPGSPVEMTGTSMAAAHVTGAAVLYLAKNPKASPMDVSHALLRQSKNLVTNAPMNTINRSLWVGDL